ncbi:MAG: hypothetical protein ACYS8X_06480 [Planctomycetota bacterium]|jgi:hypothetical protein
MNAIVQWLIGIEGGELAGADSWRVGFVSEFGPSLRLLLVAIFAAMIWLTIRSYRREGTVARRTKGILTALRIAVITAVALILLRPAIILRYIRDLRSTVVVLVDESLSMSFTDHYADADRRARLAERLGIDEAELAGMGRDEIVQRTLARQDGVLGRLAVDHPLLIMGFSADRSPGEAFSRVVAHVDAGDDRPVEQAMVGASDAIGSLSGVGFGTDIPRAVRDALQRTHGQRLAAIVIISDGQITAVGGDARLLAAMRTASDRPVPVYSVMTGDPTPRKNLTLVGMDGPDEVRRKSDVELTVLLAHRNLGGRKVTVQLQRRAAGETDWQSANASANVTLADNDENATDLTAKDDSHVQDVTLQIRPDEEGTFEFRAVVATQPDEQDQDDNISDPLTIRVTDEKVNVLLISSGAGWEFQYLRNFLLRSEDLYRSSIWQQNADPEVNQAASTGMKLPRLPRDRVDLIGKAGDADKPGYQIVVLIDPQPTQEGFDAAFVDMLSEFVDRGGGLCYVAGNKHTDTVLLGARAFKPLVTLMPVTIAPNMIDLAERIGTRRPQPWPIRLTGYGRDHQIMRLAGSVDASEKMWDALPGIFWAHPVGRVKGGARVLAEHSNPLRRTGRDKPEPVIATHSFGAGRVAYLGFNSTWRWRFVRDGYYHRRFWANLVRYLGAGGVAKRVTISTGGHRFDAGKPIEVEVEAYDKSQAPIKTPTFELVLINVDTDQRETISLTAVDVEDQPGLYSGVIDETITAHHGRFHLTAWPDDPNVDEIVAARDIVIELPQAEGINKEADEPTMRLIGSRSMVTGENGGFLLLADIDSLAERIPPDRRRSVHQIPRELWDSRLALLLIIALLTAEWLGRKRHNMA